MEYAETRLEHNGITGSLQIHVSGVRVGCKARRLVWHPVNGLLSFGRRSASAVTTTCALQLNLALQHRHVHVRNLSSFDNCHDRLATSISVRHGEANVDKACTSLKVLTGLAFRTPAGPFQPRMATPLHSTLSAWMSSVSFLLIQIHQACHHGECLKACVRVATHVAEHRAQEHASLVPLRQAQSLTSEEIDQQNKDFKVSFVSKRYQKSYHLHICRSPFP